MISVSFNNFEIKDGQVLSKAYAQTPIYLDWDMEDGVYYTVIIYDIDAPSPSNQEYPFCHYLVVNMTIYRNQGDEILSYLPPNPPEGGKPHGYYINIFKQEEQTSPDYNIVYERQAFDVLDFIERHNLVLYDEFYFKVTPKRVGL